MSAWWVVAAFALGWIGCWYLQSWIIHSVLRRPHGKVFANVIASMKQDSLLTLDAAVDAEITKRKAS